MVESTIWCDGESLGCRRPLRDAWSWIPNQAGTAAGGKHLEPVGNDQRSDSARRSILPHLPQHIERTATTSAAARTASDASARKGDPHVEVQAVKLPLATPVPQPDRRIIVADVRTVPRG